MAATELLEVEVDISEMCLRCTVDNECVRDAYSSRFRFGGAGWKLNYFKDGVNCYLFLNKCSGEPPRPFHVSVHVEGSEDGRVASVLPEVTSFRDEIQVEDVGCLIWEKEEQEILRSVPEFRMNGILKLIVVLKPEVRDEECICATCKFTATEDNDPSLESFLKDLGDLLDQDSSTDVEFRCAVAYDNIVTSVKAHKLLVCARSPVLAAMLHSDMVEGRTCIATIKDMDAGVFKQFLKYLYSGKLDETTVDAAMSLYEAGDRFQVKSLTKHCAKWMVRNLTIDNSCEVLVFADAHCHEEFAEATVTFMANSEVPRVFDGWKHFRSKHPSLAIRVRKRFAKIMFKGMSPEGEYCFSRRRRIM